MPQSRPYTVDRIVRIAAGLMLAAAVIWIVNILRNVLLPFCLACLIAYLLEPLVELNRKCLRLKGRVIASFLTILEVTVVIGGLMYLFMPTIIKEIRQLEDIAVHNQQDRVSIPFVPEDIYVQVRQWIHDLKINELIESSYFKSLIHSGTSLLSTVVSFLLHTVEWLLTFIYVIFILIDYDSLASTFKMMIPPKHRPRVLDICNDIVVNMNRYFRGQFLIASCAAVFYSIGFSIVGIPLAVVIGITVGILYMIPYFQYVTIIPVIIVCLIDSATGNAHFWSELGGCILVYVVSQCICDYILTPKIMGKAMGLNPAIILLSLSVWGTLMGLIGMIIALPLTALILSCYQRYINAPGNDPEAKTLK